MRNGTREGGYKCKNRGGSYQTGDSETNRTKGRNRTGNSRCSEPGGRVRTTGVSVGISHKERVYQENRTRLLNTSPRRYITKNLFAARSTARYLIITPTGQACRCANGDSRPDVAVSKIRTITLAYPLPHRHRHTWSYSDATDQARQNQRRDLDRFLPRLLATCPRS